MYDGAPNVRIDRRENAAGRVTRELLLVTAERLFADEGIDKVSMREIVQAAGLGNVAAVQFHFRNKDGLLHSIVRYRAPQTDGRRSVLLDELCAHTDRPDPFELMRVLVAPVAEHVEDPDDRYVSFQARLKATGSVYGHPVAKTAASSALSRWQQMMISAFSDCPPSVLDRRLGMVIDWMVQALATYERSVIAHESVMPLSVAVDDLVEVLGSALFAKPV